MTAYCTWLHAPRRSLLLFCGHSAGLLRAFVNCVCAQVFDHIPGFEECGAGLSVQSNGFAALAAIDERLCQAIIESAWRAKDPVTHNLEGIARCWLAGTGCI